MAFSRNRRQEEETHDKFEANIENSIATPNAQYSNARGICDVNQEFSTPVTPSFAYAFSLPMQESSFPGTTLSDNPTFPLADMSSMMFPNPDPFAYPNQQSGANTNYDVLLKNLQTNQPFSGPANNSNGFMPPEQQHGTILFQDPQQHFQHQPSSQEVDVQLLGPMPMYMMQGTSSGVPYNVYEHMVSGTLTPPSAPNC